MITDITIESFKGIREWAKWATRVIMHAFTWGM
jgi:hypothetical protein